MVSPTYWLHRLDAFFRIAGGRVPVDPTERMRAATVGWLSAITIVIQFFFALLNLLRDPTGGLSVGNLGIAALLFVNLLVYRRTGWVRTHTVPAVAVLLGWLIWASFRVDVGVLVWAIVFPVPVSLMLGAREGLLWNVCFGLVLAAALALHRSTFPARFELLDLPLAFLAISLLSLIGETARARFAQRMIELSSYDSLTGLLNRRVLEERARAEIDRARRYNHPVSLLLLDADHFKSVNDRSGHAEGDRVLVELARQVRSTLRTIDSVGRWGGEEVAAVLPETGSAAAGLAAERLRRSVAEAPELSRHGVSISVGVAEVQPDETFESALRRADEALYVAKNSGRNCVRVAAGSPFLAT